jgi:acyl-coenzyme A thioesterase PaaI-like protein
MKVSYISQATPGSRLIAEARTVRRVKTVVFLEADIKTAEGKLVATASSTVMVTQMKR